MNWQHVCTEPVPLLNAWSTTASSPPELVFLPVRNIMHGDEPKFGRVVRELDLAVGQAIVGAFLSPSFRATFEPGARVRTTIMTEHSGDDEAFELHGAAELGDDVVVQQWRHVHDGTPLEQLLTVFASIVQDRRQAQADAGVHRVFVWGAHDYFAPYRCYDDDNNNERRPLVEKLRRVIAASGIPTAVVNVVHLHSAARLLDAAGPLAHAQAQLRTLSELVQAAADELETISSCDDDDDDDDDDEANNKHEEEEEELTFVRTYVSPFASLYSSSDGSFADSPVVDSSARSPVDLTFTQSEPRSWQPPAASSLSTSPSNTLSVPPSPSHALSTSPSPSNTLSTSPASYSRSASPSHSLSASPSNTLSVSPSPLSASPSVSPSPLSASPSVSPSPLSVSASPLHGFSASPSNNLSVSASPLSASPSTTPSDAAPSRTTSESSPARLPAAAASTTSAALPFDVVFPFDESQYVSQRDMIARELLSSEMVYVAQLKHFLDHFVEPLDPKKPGQTLRIITQQDFRVLGLHHLQLIYPVNQVLLEGMCQVIGKSWSNAQQIGARFLSFAPFLKMYSEYTDGYGAAQAKLERLCSGVLFAAATSFLSSTSSFHSFVRSFEKLPDTRGLTVAQFLILPVQRIPRYVLLLRELARITDAGHPDKADLVKTVQALEDVAGKINQSVALAEGRKAVLTVQSSFRLLNRNLVEPHRYVLHRDLVTKLGRGGDHERYLVLFNDVLLLGDPLPCRTAYRFLLLLSVARLRVADLPDEIGASSVSTSAGQQLAMHMSVYSGARRHLIRVTSDEESFDFYCPSADAKKQWLDKFKQAELSPKDERDFQAPVWMQDRDSSVCLCCNRLFDTFHRRHHCRRCGLLFCKNCCSLKVLLSKSRRVPERVCNDCHEIISSFERGARSSFSQASRDASEHDKLPPAAPTERSVDVHRLTDLS